jgi:epoxyqueuosine reductase
MSGPGPVTADAVKQRARGLGFTHVGIAPALQLDDEARHLREWIDRGYEAGMHWMDRNGAKRGDPGLVLPGVRSIIAVAMNYNTPHAHRNAPGTGKISRYAWGDDYHDLLGARLTDLCAWIRERSPGADALWYVDTGPVMEKVWAQRAGIGWQGKHTNIITGDMGSWVFLGEVLTTLELEPDAPATDHCGTCTLCIDACPTAAIVEPYVVDSRRCLSYLTIEHRGDVDPELTGRYQGWVYGCDICQDVCPWNQKFAQESTESAFQPRGYGPEPELQELAALTPGRFAEMFAGSPIKRAKHEGLARNARILLDAGDGGASDPAGPSDASYR